MSKYPNNRNFYLIDAMDYEYYISQGGVPGTYNEWLEDEMNGGLRQRMIDYAEQNEGVQND